MDNIVIEFIERGKQHSEYDWANITVDNERVGKTRCLIEPNALTIFSINVFPEYQGMGYATKFIDKVKEEFEIIIADRVRATAVGFWEKMGFTKEESGNWIFIKQK